MQNKEDFMKYAKFRIEKKKAEIEKGKQAVITHMFENTMRINKRLGYLRGR